MSGEPSSDPNSGPTRGRGNDDPTAASNSIAGGVNAAPMEQPGTRIGPYVLERVLGEGGFGVVWLAQRQDAIVQTVALKILKPGMDSGSILARFEQERQALAVMDHPNIAKVFDAGTAPSGRPFFVMELVRGPSLTAFCDRERLGVPARLELLAKVCDAVQHAHAKGLIHRDLKPSNVLVEAIDGRPEPKIIDFGIAKAIQRPLTERTLFTETGALLGTPEYMSPEQAGLGRSSSGTVDVDTRSDVYSLGVMLYELLTGELPFDPRELRSAGFAEIERIIRDVDPPRPSTKLSRLTRGQTQTATAVALARSTRVQDLERQLRLELEWIPLKAMRKDREERYRSPADMADDLRAYLAGRPLRAGPESGAYRARKFVRRHRGAVLAGSVVALALVAGAGMMAYGLVQSQRSLKLANAATLQAQAEALRARTAGEFLSGMFERADPDTTSVRDPGMLSVLDAGVRRLDSGSLREQPIVEANLRTIIGQTYRALGRLTDADTQLRKASTLLSVLTPPDPEALARTRSALGHLLIDQDRLDAAKTELEAALALQPASASTSPSRDLVDTTVRLGLLYERQGQPGQALEQYTRAVDLAARVPVNSGSILSDALNQLGQAQVAMGKPLDGVATHRRALDARVAAFGASSRQAGESQHNLGAALLAAGQVQPAIDALTLAADIWSRILPEAHPRTASTQRVLASAYKQLGDLNAAERCSREALRIREQVFGPSSATTADSLDNLAGILLVKGQAKEAATMYQRVVDIQRAIAGPENLNVATPLTGLADALAQSGEAPEAVIAGREALRIRVSKLPKDHWMVYSSQSVLGAALAANGEFAAAETELLAAHAGLLAQPQANGARIRTTADRLVRLYQSWGKPDEAARWRERAGRPLAP